MTDILIVIFYAVGAFFIWKGGYYCGRANGRIEVWREVTGQMRHTLAIPKELEDKDRRK